MTLLHSIRVSVFSAVFACVPCAAAAASNLESNLEFESGTKGWQTVLDGVMGGLSTGKIGRASCRERV